MSAVKVMDPKMDAGMLCNRSVPRIVSFDQAIQDKILKLDDFEETEIIGIIDSTLACLVSWLEGHSLAQTVFINLYLHKPYMIEDRILKAFCLAIYKLLEIIKDVVDGANVYEEGDFQAMQYDYHLNPDMSKQHMIDMLKEVEEDLHRKCRSQPTEEKVQALHARIKFLRIFLQVLINFKRDDPQQSLMPERERLIVTCIETLFIIRDTVHLGLKSDDANNELILGFEPTINQRLLPPTFPPYIKIKSRSEALAYFIDMTDRFKVVCKIESITSWNLALDFFIKFSETNPCILSRSALQLLYSGSKESNLRGILREAVKSFICPPALLSESLLSNSQAQLYVDSFLSRCSRPFQNFLQLCGHNRARQRDKLALLLEEFRTLQDEAERVDAFLHSLSMNSSLATPHVACFGTWVLFHTLRIMIMYLLAGFELELYGVHEFYFIYWYLYDFLYGWLISALTQADTFLMENEARKKPQYKNENVGPNNRDIIYLEALQNMCGGYFKALMAFRLEGKLQMPDAKTEQLRYEHIFAPFQNLLTPPPVAYSEFRDRTFEQQQRSLNSDYLYTAGFKHFRQARLLLESIHDDPEAANLLAICKPNFLVLKVLAGGSQKGVVGTSRARFFEK